MRIGIITGASSGLGRAFARRVDATRNLDELWLVARREARLQELASEVRTRCRVLPLDLTRPEAIQSLQETLEEEQPQIELLICAAGFGKFGRAQDMSLSENDSMIALNCRAAVDVTKICLPYMGQGSRILEICSSSAFQPLPGMNLYAATKAFLLHYTRALRQEVADQGIQVTAVCPAWIQTEFEQVARQTKNADAVRKITRLAQRPEAVAAWALSMNQLGLAVATCGPMALAQRIITKVTPAGLSMCVWDLLRKI